MAKTEKAKKVNNTKNKANKSKEVIIADMTNLEISESFIDECTNDYDDFWKRKEYQEKYKAGCDLCCDVTFDLTEAILKHEAPKKKKSWLVRLWNKVFRRKAND